MEKKRKLTAAAFILYLAILTWAILFKFAVGPDTLPFRHEINLIPFDESLYAEVIFNILAFIPIGVYISIFKKNWSAGKRILAGFLISLAYEAAQFVFSLGLLDVTDFMTNTAGVWIGIGIYSALRNVFGDKTEKTIDRIALMLEIVFICLMAVILFAGRGA